MRHELRRIGDGGQAVLCETRRAITPFGGLVVLVEYLRLSGVIAAVRERMPFAYTSNNAMRPEHTLMAFWLGVAAGAHRFAQLQMLRCDRALQGLCGLRGFPSDDTVRNFFRRFGPEESDRFFLSLWRWLFAQQSPRTCTLDLDSTVFQRYGRQQGAERSYNPTRRNGRSHHPLVAFITEPVLVLHSWLRAGDASDARGTIEFLTEALGLLPATWPIGGVRADGGFFDQKLCAFLEARHLPYIIVARRTTALQRQIWAVRTWDQVTATSAVAEFEWQLPTWTQARRFIVVRLRLPDPQERRLLDVPGYEYRVFVTNRAEAPEWLWHHYDQRAAIEPRFSELKRDLGADGFCLQRFYPTEAAFRSVLFVFNLLSLLQELATAGAPQRRPATLRTSLFVCGAALGRSGHKIILYLSAAWGGLAARKPLLDKILDRFPPTSPKLNLLFATAPP
jgi:hypothetical protein